MYKTNETMTCQFTNDTNRAAIGAHNPIGANNQSRDRKVAKRIQRNLPVAALMLLATLLVLLPGTVAGQVIVQGSQNGSAVPWANDREHTGNSFFARVSAWERTSTNLSESISVSVGVSVSFPPSIDTTITYGTNWGTDKTPENGKFTNRGTVSILEVLGRGVAGGGTYDAEAYNFGTISNLAEVKAYGRLYNQGTANINALNVHEFGWVTNEDNAKINTVYVGKDGRLVNQDSANIVSATVYSGGQLDNNGFVNNILVTPTISTVTVQDGGLVNNDGAAHIGTANLYGGTITNQNGATINALAATGGIINNLDNATIGNVHVEGGTVYLNSGTNGTRNSATGASIDAGNGANGARTAKGTAGINGAASGLNGSNVTDTGTIDTATIQISSILYSGSGGNGANGGRGGNGGNGRSINDDISGAEGGYGGNGGGGGKGGTGGNGSNVIVTADSRSGGITTANILSGGTLYNGSGGAGGIGGAGGQGRGHITTAVLNGGTLNNGSPNGGVGTIENLIYVSGYYLENGSSTNAIAVGRATTNGNTTGITNSLQIGNGSIASDLARNIELVNSNNSLTFDHSNALTHSNVISGNGSLTKSGSGTLILTGANTYTGDTLVNAGTLDNRGTINRATVNSGTLANSGTVNGTATVNGGNLTNYASGTVGTLAMFGGTVTNAGWIGDMTYGSGTFNGAAGEIGSLTIGGYSNGTNNFGTVDNLSFDSDGSGYMTINGYVDPVDGGLSFMPSFQASTVDLTGGNLLLDLASTIVTVGDYGDFESWTYGFANTFENGLGTFGVWGASWGDLFGIDDDLVSGWELLNTVSVGYGDEWAYIWKDGGMTHDMWNVNDWGVSAVPEPATLVLVALGLAGLGLARRRRK